MMELKGYITHETDDAICFSVTDDLCMHLAGKDYWFPKSKIKLPRRQDGEIKIRVQNWIYDQNVNEPDYKN